MTDRIIGAFGVLDLDRLYIIPWSVRILRLSVGWLVLPIYAFKGFFFTSPILERVVCLSLSFLRLSFANLQHRRLVEVFKSSDILE